MFRSAKDGVQLHPTTEILATFELLKAVANMRKIEYRYNKHLPDEKLIALYHALDWSSAKKPEELSRAIANSHTVVSAWDDDQLVGLGNALSDGHLVAYLPHLLVTPKYQHLGIGKEIVRRLQEVYAGFHQMVVVADGQAIEFYKKCGFSRAGSCQALWIYHGHDHD